MKIVLLSVVLVSCFVGINSQCFFYRRFFRPKRICLPSTPKVTTTTTTTTTAATTTRPLTKDLCNGRPRKWSSCFGDPPTKSTMDKCRKKKKKCSDGEYLGSIFASNFNAPSQDEGPVVSQAGSKAVLGRGLSIVPFVTKHINKAKSKPACKVENNYNSNGTISFGVCRRTNRKTTSARSKRSIIQTKRDLVIMMDESGSVGEVRFEKVKRLAAAIVRLLCDQISVDPELTRVSVMSFDRKIRIPIKLLGKFRDNPDGLADYIINKIKYNRRTGGRTCMLDALDAAYNVALGSNRGGRRGKPNTEQDIIIITDGCENCPNRRGISRPVAPRIREMTSRFIENDVHVYVIGIGLDESCKETLSLLAQGGRCVHFFYLSQWDYDVNEFIDALENPPDDICLNVFESPLDDMCLPPFG